MRRHVRQPAADPIRGLRESVIGERRIESNNHRIGSVAHDFEPAKPQVVVEPGCPQHEQPLHTGQIRVKIVSRRMGRSQNRFGLRADAELTQVLDVLRRGFSSNCWL